MFFLELSCFFHDPADVGNLISCSSTLSKSSLNIWKFTVHILLKPGLENFEHYFTSMWNECNCAVVWAFFGIAFFGIGTKTDCFQSCAHCWVFQICWHTECSTFTKSYFRIWNSSTGILSPPLALFVVMLPKAHLTSYSRMSGSRWVIIPSWLSGSWRSFLYSSSVYSCHLFLISSASVRSMPFLSFIEPIFAWNVPLVSLIFWRDPLVFPFLLFSLFLCIDHWGRRSYLFLLFFGTLHSNGYIFPFILCLLLLFSSQLFVRPPQTTMLPSCTSFSWGQSCSVSPVQCHKPPSIILQALCLSDLIHWIYFSLPLYIRKGFDLGRFRSYLNGLVFSLLSSI